ncbi:MAG: GH36 C-terminal domain-containing protein [Lachnospiraceae bacterium]
MRLHDLPEDALYRREEDGAVFPAAALMETGLPLPQESGDYASWQWHFVRVTD